MTSLTVAPVDAADQDFGFDLLETVLSHCGGAHAAPRPTYRWFWISFLVIVLVTLGVAASQLFAVGA
jgi:hypothetical protein